MSNLSNPSEAETTRRRTNRIALFMAFGTKGDVHPLAAVAAAFANGMKDYRVFFVTHSAHQNLSAHLADNYVTFLPISSPPVLSIQEDNDCKGLSFSLQKKQITSRHRQECLSAVDGIFGVQEIIEGDFVLINFFALEGWSLAELFQVPCVIAAPYVVPYSAPSSFERQFKTEFPFLYDYLRDAPNGKDPVTSMPTWHKRDPSPLLLYGFSEDIVEHPGILDSGTRPTSESDYWPPNVHTCGFWFTPIEWQFTCEKCFEVAAFESKLHSSVEDPTCPGHVELQSFVKTDTSKPLVFVGLSSIGSMGFMRCPRAFLSVLQRVTKVENVRFVLLTAGYEPLQEAVLATVAEKSSTFSQRQLDEDGIILFDGRLFCFSGTIPYQWLFRKCAVAVHHGGSGSTAAALHAGIPQVICPFYMDQFYWAERMFWLGVAPEPLKACHLLPDNTDDMCIMEAANFFVASLESALSPEVQARASELSSRISLQEGVLEAVKILKREICCGGQDFSTSV